MFDLITFFDKHIKIFNLCLYLTLLYLINLVYKYTYDLGMKLILKNIVRYILN